MYPGYNLKKVLSHALAFLGKDLLFTVSMAAALLTSLFFRPRFAAIDWKVIVCLFGLMAVVKGLEACGVLTFLSSKLIKRCGTRRGMLLVVCLLSFFSSMVLTNDVAILTLLPILFVVGKASGMDMLLPTVMVTISANLGSAATPFGNPQNLFLYSYYGMKPTGFFAAALPFAAVALLVLLLVVRIGKNAPLSVQPERAHVSGVGSIVAYGIAALITILCVLDVIPYLVSLPVVLLVTLRFQRHVLRLVDYRLLLTFLFLFIAIDNLSRIPLLREQLASLTGTQSGVYWSSALLSQGISNVPCAVLLAPFTDHAKALLLGVNVGGLGTLVASMANLIAYKLYCREYPVQAKAYLNSFTLWNALLFVLIGGIVYWLLLNI